VRRPLLTALLAVLIGMLLAVSPALAHSAAPSSSQLKSSGVPSVHTQTQRTPVDRAICERLVKANPALAARAKDGCYTSSTVTWSVLRGPANVHVEIGQSAASQAAPTPNSLCATCGDGGGCQSPPYQIGFTYTANGPLQLWHVTEKVTVDGDTCNPPYLAPGTLQSCTAQAFPSSSATPIGKDITSDGGYTYTKFICHFQTATPAGSNTEDQYIKVYTQMANWSFYGDPYS